MALGWWKYWLCLTLLSTLTPVHCVPEYPMPLSRYHMIQKLEPCLLYLLFIFFMYKMLRKWLNMLHGHLISNQHWFKFRNYNTLHGSSSLFIFELPKLSFSSFNPHCSPVILDKFISILSSHILFEEFFVALSW